MNATPHTVIGYSMLKLAGGNPLGCLLAFVSHLVADYVNENGLKTIKQRIIFDVIPTIILFIASYFYGGWYEVWLVFLGSVFGNLPDLIDKKLYLTILFPSKFKSTEYLHWQKPIINPNELQTKIIGYVAMILIIIITICHI